MQVGSFRCGLIAFALAISLCAAAKCQGQPTSNEHKQPNRARQHRATDDAWPWPVTWQAKGAAVIAEQQATATSNCQKTDDKPKDDEDSHLYDRISAKASQIQAHYSRRQFQIGIPLGIISLLAAVFTGWAAWAAAAAAKSAQSSVEFSKMQLLSLERAFVFCDGIYAIDTENEDATPLFSIKFINSGKTPTRHGRVYWSWQLFTPDIPNDFEFANYGSALPGTTFIGPGAGVTLGPIPVGRQYLNAALERKGVLYFWAWCEYDDIFEGTTRHRTEYCCRLAPQTSVDPAGGQQKVGIAFWYHEKFNGTDDDCIRPIETGSPKNPLPPK